MGRVIFIGDVHGCLVELQELVGKLAPTDEDRVLLLGDLIDKGPDPVGVVCYVRSHGWTSLMGNHDRKAVLWHQHEARRVTDPSYRNPIHPYPGRVAEWMKLSTEDVAFLASCPYYIQVGDWVAVHGGFVPHLPLDKQVPSDMVRCRWVDAKGESVSLEPGNPHMPKGARPWMAVYDGAYNVVCGHAAHSLAYPRVDRPVPGYEIWSIDTGCAFGGRLSALRNRSRYGLMIARLSKCKPEALTLDGGAMAV